MEQDLQRKLKRKKLRSKVLVAFGVVLIILALFAWQNSGDRAEQGTVTLEITCKDLTDDPNALQKRSLVGVLPKDGVILAPTEYGFGEGETVYDCLEAVCMDNDIHMESSESAVYGSRYVEGIGHLYEKDAGSRSGWTYEVNGRQPEYGCSEVKLKDGDRIRWVYVVDYTRSGSGTEVDDTGEVDD